MINSIEIHKTDSKKLDTDYVISEGKKINAIFDTKASDSVITSKILSKIQNKNFIKKNEEFILINGSKVNVTRAINLLLEYRDKIYEETFNIIENENMEEILNAIH
ncbi:hypothetical protein DMUE_2705 [Dictyocoela muelleri]|nr:hypothetical protein DMUE_2705 [Dictyocoela muelleri]